MNELNSKMLGETAKKSIVIRTQKFLNLVQYQGRYVFYGDLEQFIKELQELKQQIRKENDFVIFNGASYVEQLGKPTKHIKEKEARRKKLIDELAQITTSKESSKRKAEKLEKIHKRAKAWGLQKDLRKLAFMQELEV